MVSFPKEILPIGNISLQVQMTILFDTVIRQNIYCHKINLSPGIPSKLMSVSADIGPIERFDIFNESSRRLRLSWMYH